MSESKKPNTYTAEFKESAVKLALGSPQPISQTAKELGLSKDTLYGWVRQALRPVEQPVPPSDPLQEELKRLRKENAQLKEERDILKNPRRGAPLPIRIETGVLALHCQ